MKFSRSSVISLVLAGAACVVMSSWMRRGAGGHDLNVKALVVAISATPDPEASAYGDCLIHIKLSTLEANREDIAPAAFIGVFWGFKGRKLKPGSELRAGDVVELRMIPFGEAPEGSAQIMRMDDIGDLTLPDFWIEEWTLLKEGPRPALAPATEVSATYQIESTGNPNVDRILGFYAGHDGKRFGYKREEFYVVKYRYLYERPLTAAPESIGPASGALPERLAPLDAIVEFDRALAERGIELIVLFPPAAAAIFPDVITGVPWSLEADGRVDVVFSEFVDELETRGIAVVDMLAELVRNRWEAGPDNVLYPISVRRGAHWSSLGAKITAQRVAAGIRGRDWYEASVAQWRGDEYRFRESVRVIDFLMPVGQPPQRVPISAVSHRIEPNRDFAHFHDMENMEAPVQVIGDSYADYQSGPHDSFYHHLVASLHLPVGMIAVSSGATDVAVQDWVRKSDLAKVKVVIWEIHPNYIVERPTWPRIKLQ